MSSSESYALPRAVKARALAGALLGLLLAALDQTIVATSSPAMQKDLAIPAGLYAWITMAYLVTSTVLVPICGKLSDLHGRRPVLAAGVVVFLAGSMLCALATGAAWLVASRAVQGIGAAALFTGAFTVAADLFPPAQRARYSGIFGAVFGFASVVGPLVGGVLTDQVGWRWVFLVNLPAGAVALAFIARMPRLGGAAAGGRLDLAGTAALVAAVVPLLVGLTRASGEGATSGDTRWTSPDVVALLALSLAGVVAFIAVERRAREPLVPLSLFANRTFALANLASFLVGGTFLATAVFLPLFCVAVLGTSATTAGLTLMPLTLAMVLANVVAGQVVARLGRTRIVLLVAMALVAVGYALLALWLRPGISPSTLRMLVIVAGLGLGPTIPIVVVAVQSAVSPRELGIATAATRFFRQLGATAGIAVLGTVFAHTLAARHGPPLDPETLSLALRSVYAVACAVAAAAFLVTLALPDAPLRRA
jgi:EmrB/QacA subfamily drug resistance transporter